MMTGIHEWDGPPSMAVEHKGPRTIMFRGRKVGIIDGNTYTSYRRPEHFCRKYNGWGIQDEVYTNDILPSGVTNINIVVGKTVYCSLVSDWEHHLCRAELRPDAGEQVFLGVSYFRVK